MERQLDSREKKSRKDLTDDLKDRKHFREQKASKKDYEKRTGRIGMKNKNKNNKKMEGQYQYKDEWLTQEEQFIN